MQDHNNNDSVNSINLLYSCVKRGHTVNKGGGKPNH